MKDGARYSQNQNSENPPSHPSRRKVLGIRCILATHTYLTSSCHRVGSETFPPSLLAAACLEMLAFSPATLT